MSDYDECDEDYECEEEYEYKLEDDEFNNGFQNDFILQTEKYSLCNYANIHNSIDNYTAYLANILDISQNKADCLFKINKWNKDNILESTDYLITDDLIYHQNTLFCIICGDDKSNNVSLSCNHTLCLDCYQLYLTDKVMDIYSCIAIKCFEYKCNHYFSKSQIKSTLDADTFDKYNKLILQNYVLNHQKNMKYCPQLGCNVISVGDYNTNTVNCICEYKYCFKCYKDAHLPCSCQDLEKWENNVDEFNNNDIWLIANTKKCPKCLVIIEKNNGCDHMTCKNCKHQFCWICTDNWKDHSPNSEQCIKYKKDIIKNKKLLYDDKDVERAKIEINKLNHYNKLIQDVNKNIDEIKSLEKNNDNMQFIKYFKNIIDFNIFLKYCYIFIIYNIHENKELFIVNFNIIEENVKNCNLLIKNIIPNVINLNNQCVFNARIINNIINDLTK
jgi:ariadne-1